MPVPVRFSREASQEAAFHRELKQRVDAWFEAEGLSKKGNAFMAFKSVFWIGASLACLALILSGKLAVWATLVVYGLMGFCFACIGFNVGHDAIHGAYSRSHRVNALLSWSYELIGANARNWAHAHNVRHHTWTNVVGADDDIDAAPFLRLHTSQPLLGHHRFQHVYAWFLYMLFTLNWVCIGDWVAIRQPHPHHGRPEPLSGYGKLLVGKLSHFGLLLALPAWVLGPWLALAGFLVFHMVGGLVLAVVFQLAHLVEGPEVFVPDEGGDLPHRWAALQLRTTANFCGDNPLVTFIVGGLDHQVEHHLFPAICHVHYPKIAPIVKEVAEAHGLPYHRHPTFFGAVASHARQLRQLGR
jgi:linoleoyl-CoA desaturase